jgi:hypothetical protein
MNPTGRNTKNDSLGISRALQHNIVNAACDPSRVSGYTHNFYKYPARFSPKFVRSVIEAFTAPGDLVVDPFMGGGTTLVEALALGRHAVGADVSALAVFVARVKTTLLNDSESEALEKWARHLCSCVNIHRPSPHFDEYAENGYYRHLENRVTWRLRKAIEQSLATAIKLDAPELEAFARCVVLKTAQWALDGRKRLPSVEEFRHALTRFANKMIIGARELREAVGNDPPGELPTVCCLQRAASAVDLDRHIAAKPRLILTSPPYPGIHVLYHRWQVDGRKETPAPFWIAGQLDGSGAAFYSMGDRKAANQRSYFDQLQAAFNSLACMCDKNTTIVQVVAFSEPNWQLPRYLEANTIAGFEEARLPVLASQRDGRLWRPVPNRKWHAGQLGKTPASQEVVLFLRRA